MGSEGRVTHLISLDIVNNITAKPTVENIPDTYIQHTMREFSICLLLAVILFQFVCPASSATCYVCTKGQVGPGGHCEEAGQTQYCRGQEWCFKQWRGHRDNTTGISWGCWDVDSTPEENRPSQDICTSEERGDGITETICYCRGELCNYAGNLSLSRLALLTWISLTFLALL